LDIFKEKIPWEGHPKKSGLTYDRLIHNTLKKYGLAGGLALAFFSKNTSVPATVSSAFMTVYIIWLEFKGRRSG